MRYNGSIEMTGRRSQRVRSILAVLWVTTILSSVACTGAGERDVDPTDAFLTRMSEESLNARADLTGAMLVNDLEFPIAGEMTIAGSDSEVEMRTETPQGVLSNAEINVGDNTFVSTNDGPWFRDEATDPKDPEELTAWMTSLSSVRNEGTEIVDGVQLFRLTPTEEVDPSMFGIADTTAGATGSVSFLVTDQGVLRLMRMTFADATDAGTLEIDVDMRFTYPTKVEVAPPADVWERHHSPRLGYSMGHPGDWQTMAGGGKDTLFPTVGEGSVGVYENRLPADMTFEEAVRMLLRIAEREFGAEFEEVGPLTVEDAKAIVGRMHAQPGDRPLYAQAAIVAKGSRLYEIYWSSPAGAETEARATFDGMVGSFRFEGDR